MLNRVVLAIILVISLAWVSYVALDISSAKNIYDPQLLFDKNDEEVLVVIRPSEINFDQLTKYQDAPCMSIIRAFPDSSYEKGFFSCKRDHFLLFKEDAWTKDKISRLFPENKLNFSSSDQFTFDSYKGRFHKTKLYVWNKDIEVSSKHIPIEFKFDQKASASILKVDTNNLISEYVDIYFKKDGRVNYITQNTNIKQGNQIKDEELFAGIITQGFDSYHFYERDYYANSDEVFKTGQMSQWMLNGFVELKIGDETVFISDYIGGQDPLLILNDLNQTQDSIRFTQPLTKNFPSENGSYYVKYLEDAVVISEKLELCDKLISDYKLGNTIALSNKAVDQLYGKLPKSVSERYSTKENSFTKAVYKGRLLETHVGNHHSVEAPVQRQPISLSCGFDIADFAVLPGNGNVVAVGTKGNLKCFKDKKELWASSLNGQAIGEIQLIDLHGTGEQFVLLNSKSEIHLWNMTGHYETGFPIKLESNASNEVKFYRWKGKSYFIIANEDQKVVHFDSKGRELNIINIGMPINRKIDIWASQRRLFAGFSSSSVFKMYDMDKRRIHREFSIPNKTKSIKIPNELEQYSVESGRVVKYDQKGIKTEFGSFTNPQIMSIQGEKSNPVLVVRAINYIHLLNSQGVQFGEIALPFNEIADIHIQTSDLGKTYLAIIDGLENNVYLYSSNGQRVGDEALEGQTKVRLNYASNQQQITTIVDQFVIQYFKD